MKIIDKNKAYVQRKDITYLHKINIAIPLSLYLKTFNIDYIIEDESTKYDFIEFDKETDVLFFSKCDFIIDYNDIKNLSIDKLTQIKKNIFLNCCKLNDKYNKIPINKQNNYKYILKNKNLLEYKLDSYDEFINYKKGLLEFKLPEGIEYSNELNTNINKEIKTYIKK